MKRRWWVVIVAAAALLTWPWWSRWLPWWPTVAHERVQSVTEG